MFKRIFIIVVGILLIGVNAFAAGDLIVNGKVGVGGGTPLYPLHITTVDESTALRIEPTIANISTVNNFGAYYRVNVTDTSLTYGVFSGFLGETLFQGGGTVNAVQGAYNLISLSASTLSNIDTIRGNTIELRRTGDNANHTIINYYGYHSFGNLAVGSTGDFSGTNWRHAYFEDLPNLKGATGSIANVAGLWIDKQTLGGNNYGIVLNGDGAGADIVFGASQQASIYSTGGLLYATDMNGNITQFSPHDPETGEWIYYSKNTKTGIVKRVNMEKLVKAVEKLTGEKFMIETMLAK